MRFLRELVLGLLVALITGFFVPWPNWTGAPSGSTDPHAPAPRGGRAGCPGGQDGASGRACRRADAPASPPLDRALEPALLRDFDQRAWARPIEPALLRDFDQRALARDAERAIAARDPDLACAVKNSLRNLSAPGAARWLDRDALRRIQPLSPALDALCPHLDSVPFRLLLERSRGQP